MNPVVQARNLYKHYGDLCALDGLSFSMPAGAISGLIGPNGAGKSTTLKALLGLLDVEGELTVVGRDPRQSRHQLMQQVCFIADVGTLPRWPRVRQLLGHVAAVHPRFDRSRAEKFLSSTEILPHKPIRQLSTGMITQLHLAIVMAMDVQLLVLDEPTLGLDILYRKALYDRLFNDYYDGRRSLLISTHQVEEIEPFLSHLLFIDRGRMVLDAQTSELDTRYTELIVAPHRLSEAEQLMPIHVREVAGNHKACIFESVPRHQLEALGTTGTPKVADLFVAKMQQAQSGERR